MLNKLGNWKLIKWVLKANRLFFLSIVMSYILSRIFFIDIKIVHKTFYLLFPSFFLVLLDYHENLKSKKKTIEILYDLFLPILFLQVLFLNSQFSIYFTIFVFLIGFLYIFNLNDSKKTTYYYLNKNLVFIFIAIFLIIKIPLLNKNFTGNNTIKYNSYVEPAKYMAETNNFLTLQRKYLADPISNTEGLYYNFVSLPTLEWLLALFYKIFGTANIEVSTRLATSLIGVFILLEIFKLISELTKDDTWIVLLSLLISNPLFIFITQITIYDSIILLIFLISFRKINFYLKNKNTKYLISSSLFFGLALLSKEVVVLWGVPIIFSYILLYNKFNLKNTLSELTLFSFSVFYFFFIFRLWKTYFLNNMLYTVFIILISMTFTIILFKFSKKALFLIKKLVFLLFKNKILLFIFLFFLLFFTVFIFKLEANNWREFITNKNLVFYWPMYFHILKMRQLLYLPIDIFILSIFGFILAIRTDNKMFKNFIISMGFGLLFYLIIASKVIFFHNYYNIYFILFYLILASFFINKLLNFKNIYTKIMFMVVFLIISIRSNYNNTWSELLLYEKEGIKEASDFLKKNTSKGDFYIDNDNTLSISIYTGLSRITNLNYKEIKDDINLIGFTETMKKYKIKYLVSSSDINFEKIFNSEKLDREKLIYLKLGSIEKIGEVESVPLTSNISNLYEEEFSFGDYKIYNLWKNK